MYSQTHWITETSHSTKLNKRLLKTAATHPQNSLLFEVDGKAELIANSLESQFSPNPGPVIMEISHSVQHLK